MYFTHTAPKNRRTLYKAERLQSFLQFGSQIRILSHRFKGFGKTKISIRLIIPRQDTRPKQIELLKKEFTAQLNTTTLKGDTNEQFDLFHDIILRSVDIHCPVRVRSLSNKKFRREPWLTAGLHISCNKQKKLYQNSISNNAKSSAVERYKAYGNTLKKLKRISKINYYKNKCEEYKRDVRKLWHMINSCIGKTNDKTTIIDHLRVENTDITDSKKIANEFGRYFFHSW